MGAWIEVLNSDTFAYAGSNVRTLGETVAQRDRWSGRAYSLERTLPPLGALILRPLDDADDGPPEQRKTTP